MKIFFDTMIFLHYMSLDQLDFNKIFGPSPHTVLVPRITLRELDTHKNTHGLNRIKKRAENILKKIKQWAEGEEVRPGVSVEFLSAMPRVDYAELGLNPDWNDDILVASVLQYKTDHPGDESVILVSQDSGPRMTAFQLDIRVLELPAEYKLPSEPDPVELENRKLAKTIETLENALPKLIVSFAGSEDSGQHARFTIGIPPSLKEEEIAREIEELKTKYPKQCPPESATLSQKQLLLAKITAFTAHQNTIAPEEYERYNRDRDSYITRYEQYMRNRWKWEAAARRSLGFSIMITNVGTAPADDVDILLHFPDGFRLFQADQLPSAPKEPWLPRKPRTRGQIFADQLGNVSNISLNLPSMTGLKMPTSFSIERTNSYDVKQHFSTIKHNMIVLLPEMGLIFDSYETAKSFSCTYTVQPANLPELVTGDLNFVVEKKGDGVSP